MKFQTSYTQLDMYDFYFVILFSSVCLLQMIHRRDSNLDADNLFTYHIIIWIKAPSTSNGFVTKSTAGDKCDRLYYYGVNSNKFTKIIQYSYFHFNHKYMLSRISID